MALFDKVDDEFKLMVCAAYGDLKGIISYTGTSPRRDVNALMVAVANHQTDAADLLKTKFPQLTETTTKNKCKWRQATHERNNTKVYLPGREDYESDDFEYFAEHFKFFGISWEDKSTEITVPSKSNLQDMGKIIRRPTRESLLVSEDYAAACLNQSVANGDVKSIEFFLTHSHSEYLQSLLHGSEGSRLFFVALRRYDLPILKVLYTYVSENDAAAWLNQAVANGDLKSVEFLLTHSHSKYLQSLLHGSEGSRLFSMTLRRFDLDIIKVLMDNGCSLPFQEELNLEHSGRNREALNMYQEYLWSVHVDESMESSLTSQMTASQVFLPPLAGKYRVKARLELESNDLESFLETVDKAWLFHVRGFTEECEDLFWTKGIVLQNLGDHDEARSVFESLVSKSSPLFVSFGLYELGMYEEAYCRLRNTPTTSREVLRLAQASRCLIRLGSVSDEARAVFQRLRVFAEDRYFKEQNLSASQVKFVTRVKHRMRALLDNQPNYRI